MQDKIQINVIIYKYTKGYICILFIYYCVQV